MSAWTKVAWVVEVVVIALQGGAVNYAITLVRQVSGEGGDKSLN